MFDWLYVLSTIVLFIIAFTSAMGDIGNSILNTLNGIKFPLVPVSILYAFFVPFWLVIDACSVNITEYILWNIKDVILTE